MVEDTKIHFPKQQKEIKHRTLLHCHERRLINKQKNSLVANQYFAVIFLWQINTFQQVFYGKRC